VKKFLTPPMKTRSFEPCTYARTLPIAPVTCTSASPPSAAAVATGEEVIKTRWKSRSYFLKRPASCAIHGIDCESTCAELTPTRRSAAVAAFRRTPAIRNSSITNNIILCFIAPSRAANALDDRSRIRRRFVAAPRDVAIRAREHQAPLVDSSRLGLVQLDDFERHPGLPRRRSQRPRFGFIVSARQQHESTPEEVERRLAAGERDVRRARAGPRRRIINALFERRRGRSVADADRRVIVAVAELDARRIVLKLLRARPENRRARLFAQNSPLFRVRI